MLPNDTFPFKTFIAADGGPEEDEGEVGERVGISLPLEFELRSTLIVAQPSSLSFPPSEFQ